jgi:predicted dienelactone hydrolase
MWNLPLAKDHHMRVVLVCGALCVAITASAEEYDPLHVATDAAVRVADFTVSDANRQREIPIRVYLPPNDLETDAAPVVVFSHGLGGTREGSPFLGRHWAARGYIAVFVQHPGSDDSVWKDLPLAKRFAAMQAAASASNSLLRLQDVPAVLDQLAIWNDDPAHELSGLLDAKRVGMSGHSFGGQTTQAISGQTFAIGGQRWTDSRIKAAIVMSPSVPLRGDVATAFGNVTRPWLLMTGTHDGGLIGGQTPESRRGVFPALPAGDKFELVLDQAEHSAFTERPLPGESKQRNPNHHRVILALSTAFWDTYLRDDQTAKQWLTGHGPRSVMEAADGWQSK